MAIAILQTVLATELVCVLRYTQHSISASGLSSRAVKAEFAEHAGEERQHALEVAERIAQLGGLPDFNPEGLATPRASQFAPGENLVDMIWENLIAERIAVEHYREPDPVFRRERSHHAADAGAHIVRGRRARR